MLINGQNRKRINLNSELYGWTREWIEGIGSIVSLTDYVYPYGNFDVYLSCYFESFGLVYGQTGDCCQGITNIQEPFINQNIFLVYPNPAHNYINLKFSTTEFKKIEIYDIQNKLLQMKNSSEKIINIKVEDYPKGIYIVKITNDKIVYFEKIIIM